MLFLSNITLARKHNKIAYKLGKYKDVRKMFIKWRCDYKWRESADKPWNKLVYYTYIRRDADDWIELQKRLHGDTYKREEVAR